MIDPDVFLMMASEMFLARIVDLLMLFCLEGELTEAEGVLDFKDSISALSFSSRFKAFSKFWEVSWKVLSFSMNISFSFK